MAFLNFFKNRWNEILGAAVIIVTALSGLVDVPVFLKRSMHSETDYDNLGRYIVAALIALLLVPCHFYNRKKYAWTWWSLALAAFLISIFFFFIYNNSKNRNTVDFREFSGSWVVKGEHYSKLANNARRTYLEQNGSELSDEKLLAGFGGENYAEMVWPKKEIVANANWILVLYITTTTVFCLFILFVIQASFCISRQKT